MCDKAVSEMVRIKKVYDKHYTVINNSILNDTSLKWEDKGLFTYLWSQSDEWDFYAKEVAKHSPDSEDKVYKILRKLEEHGYLLRQRQRNNKGQLKANKWLLSETPRQKWISIYKKRIDKKDAPIRQNPEQVKPDLEKPNVVKPDLTSTNCNKYLSKQIKNLNKSLSNERKRDQEVIEILINYLNEFANEWHRAPITFSPEEYKKLVNAVHNKETSSLRNLAEKTVIYSEQYPQGYLLNCIKNLPDVIEDNDNLQES